MSSVETGQMSAVGTGQMSPAETGEMSLAETGQMSTGQQKTFGCFEVILGRSKVISTQFFTPKMGKMEHARWSWRSRRSHGNDTTSRAADPHSTRAGGQDYVSS